MTRVQNKTMGVQIKTVERHFKIKEIQIKIKGIQIPFILIWIKQIKQIKVICI